MPAARKLGLGLLGSLVGAILGGILGLFGGLGYTELVAISGFEGYSGYVVVFWMLGAILIGIVVGPILVLRRMRRAGQR